MIKALKALCCVALLAVSGTSVCAAERWSVGSISAGSLSNEWTGQGSFVFDKGVLSFEGTYRTYPNTSNGIWTSAKDHIVTYGIWAVCGTVSNNQLVRDPYATFVETSHCTGYISWAANTPVGYVAPLMLGAKFEGFGGGKGPADWGTPLKEDSTLVWKWSINVIGAAGGQGLSNPGTHTFYATPVPEPASMLTLLAGVGGLAGFAVRRRR